MLFIHGGIAVCWVAALSVFSTGVVPIYFCMSQFGLQHQAITNVIITGVATLSTTHLLLTIKSRPDSGDSGLGRERARNCYKTLLKQYHASPDQVGGNTTTAVVGRTYVKDNFSYAVIGTFSGSLLEVVSVAITAQCISSQGDSANVTLISAVPGSILLAVNFTNGTSAFVGSLFSDAGWAVIMKASEAGGLMTVDANRFMVSCTWSVTPQLIHVAIRGFTATAVSSEDSLTVPAPIERGVYWVVQGMAVAIASAPFSTGTLLHGPSVIVQTLIADRLKETLTTYTA
ncbi:hypothetical protein B0H14DRAFT_3446382 [Mycena olivaceomarginata]|nr:hypothetical protein B0H14DRAFT_3446382 [Mycena olivaceomarginata]